MEVQGKTNQGSTGGKEEGMEADTKIFFYAEAEAAARVSAEIPG